MRLKTLSLLAALASSAAAAYWMEDIPHRGISPFNPDKSYTVFRNVKDFGAKGDGVADDTNAINAAISSGNRCGGDSPCAGTTTTPAVVYFPKGTYLISSSIVSYYYTQMIGDPTSMPVIKAAQQFRANGLGLIEANPYQSTGYLRYGATNTFFRQIRNLVLDTRQVPGAVCGIHWPSSQATSIQNVVFRMSYDPSRHHSGIFMEEGSGGMLNDLVFYGGEYGAQFGNQQYTARNFTFHGSQTAILQIWDWGWTYKSMTINNCRTGIDMTSSSVGSVTLLDSHFNNVDVGIITGRDPAVKEKPGAGSLVIQNVQFRNVSTILKGAKGDIIQGSPSATVIKRGFGHGNAYAPYGPSVYQASDVSHFPVPQALTAGEKYYERSKPQYDDTPASSFLSARSYGARGDGVTDDTDALNRLMGDASKRYSEGIIAFIDAGYYRVTDTVFFPPNLRVVGEAMSSVIMAAGSKFSHIDRPHPVVQVGKPGDKGYLEFSDVFVSTQGATAGAVLIEYNLATYTSGTCKLTSQSTPPSGMWDVHTRIGGFAGSELQVAECLKTPDKANAVNPLCIAAYMSCHITKSARGLYMENNWFWVADHDIEDYNNTQISIYAGRGLLIESKAGRIWLVGTSVEHHTLYQYQLAYTKNIWMGQIQTETAYYQPNPPAPFPFTTLNKTIHDPNFALDCRVKTGNGTSDVQPSAETLPILTLADSLPGKPPCEMGWGLRIIGSKNVVVYGAGLYSFFNNWSTSCCQEGFKTHEGVLGKCQARILYIGGDPASSTASNQGDGKSDTLDVSLYNLNTVGVVSMINRQGTDLAYWKENKAGFTDTVAVFKFQNGRGTGNVRRRSSGEPEDPYDGYGDGDDGSPDGSGDSGGSGSGSRGSSGGYGAGSGIPGLSWGGPRGFVATEGEAGYICFGDWQQLCGQPPQFAQTSSPFSPPLSSPLVRTSLVLSSPAPVPTTGGGRMSIFRPGDHLTLNAASSQSSLSASSLAPSSIRRRTTVTFTVGGSSVSTPPYPTRKTFTVTVVDDMSTPAPSKSTPSAYRSTVTVAVDGGDSDGGWSFLSTVPEATHTHGQLSTLEESTWTSQDKSTLTEKAIYSTSTTSRKSDGANTTTKSASPAFHSQAPQELDGCDEDD
ncbi:hypothetical protein MAPG_02145 [Magnaporthiopsis poae ATCC 64411]|uniref:Rhamnogalacturonase A/B/Epimerase-like pectate lyase domain-containing protein n=1 Tax=Magnaporthiopsis poae (strain ATCC 64411 / 73-15) TaxID=644358 RepID=A0A0C4DQK1_MAGP6|nr:hypothetical protein MAPG_02145 [Magnaporthiopsis poae ATCC 64411]